MKRTLCVCLGIGLGFLLACDASWALIAGDVDGNNKVNAIDVQFTINRILGFSVPYNTDIDYSGKTNAIDVQLIINVILGFPIDLNDNGVPDVSEPRLQTKVTALAINAGATTASNRSVTLDNTCNGSPTEYMASESATFADAAWQPYSSAPIFTLSSGDGEKTVYFKVRKYVLESAAVADGIALNTPATPEVLTFRLNGGSVSTTLRTVTLDNECSGEPTEYMASESALFTGASWLPYSGSPDFQLSSGNGAKTVYFKVRKSGAESSAASATISLNEPVVPQVLEFRINEGASETYTRTVTLNNACSGSPTQYMASESPTFVGASWQAYATAPSFTLSAGDGTKQVYFQVRNASGVSSTFSDTIALKAPEVTSFRINDGTSTTTSLTVYLTNDCTGAPTEYMASESPSFTGASWAPYAVLPSFTLSAGSGTKTVYFKVRNSVDESSVVSDTISVTLPVVTTFQINNGASTTSGVAVTLNNTCTGSPSEYMASESPSFSGASWQLYSTAPAFTLTGGDGVKQVYFKARNSAGESSAVSASITLQTSGVTPVLSSFAINSGAAATTSRTVTLNNTCTGAPTEYMASESASFTGAAWAPYSNSPGFTLSTGNGTKTVYFKVRNVTGTSATLSDTIQLNAPTAPAIGSFGINNGAGTATSANVTLDNVCTNTPTEYMASESPGFEGASWLPYATAPAFTLSQGNGIKTVYLKVRNAAGESSGASDTIVLDIPSIPHVTAFAINDGAVETTVRSVVLNNTCTELPTEYIASESSSFSGASWMPYSVAPSFVLSTGNGAKTVYLKVRNALGESETASASISLNEPTSPTVTMFALAGGASTSAVRVVALNNTCAGSPTEYMASESASFTGASWQTYASAPSFTLSSGNGVKTVYFKVRNAAGESPTVSDTIQLEEPTLPVVESMAINGGATETTSATVTINSVCGGTPTEYMASLSPSFSGATWLPYSASLSFTLTGDLGTKTVYFKVRNASGESGAASDTILFAGPPSISGFAINSGASSTGSVDVTLNHTAAGSPTEYMASESPTFTGASWQAYAAAPAFALSSGNGSKTVYLKVRNTYGESASEADVIVLDIPAVPGEVLELPTTTFLMGATAGEPGGRGNELPQHSVTLSAYTIGKYEVTNGEFADALNWALSQGILKNAGNAPYDGGDVYAYGVLLYTLSASTAQIAFSAGTFGPITRDGYSMADHPVGQVTWYGAAAYCNWLSAVNSLTPRYSTTNWALISGSGYRLPTEAEWEHAAAWDGVKHWIYGMLSDTISSSQANYLLTFGDPSSAVNPLGLTSAPYTAPVGHFNGATAERVNGPSPSGCYDMSGNVWEWCQDWYGAYPSSPQTNPTGPTTGTIKVLRGGAYSTDGPRCRTAYRNETFAPTSAAESVGFRIAR